MLPPWAIIAIAVGGSVVLTVLCIAALLCLVCCCCRKNGCCNRDYTEKYCPTGKCGEEEQRKGKKGRKERKGEQERERERKLGLKWKNNIR